MTRKILLSFSRQSNWEKEKGGLFPRFRMVSWYSLQSWRSVGRCRNSPSLGLPQNQPSLAQIYATFAKCGIPGPHQSNIRKKLNSYLNLHYGLPEDIRGRVGREELQNNTTQQLYKFSHSCFPTGPVSEGSRLWPLPRLCQPGWLSSVWPAPQ